VLRKPQDSRFAELFPLKSFRNTKRGEERIGLGGGKGRGDCLTKVPGGNFLQKVEKGQKEGTGKEGPAESKGDRKDINKGF